MQAGLAAFQLGALAEGFNSSEFRFVVFRGSRRGGVRVLGCGCVDFRDESIGPGDGFFDGREDGQSRGTRPIDVVPAGKRFAPAKTRWPWSSTGPWRWKNTLGTINWC